MSAAAAKRWDDDAPTVEQQEPEWAAVTLSALHGEARRLDGETYLTGGYGLRLQIEAQTQFRRLGELADVWQPGRLKGTQITREHGMPFFTATQVFDVRPVARKWLAPGRTPDLRRRFVEPGWILVTCSGSVGDAIMSYAPHREHIISHDLLRVQPKKPYLRGYLYAFLRSQYGRAIARSTRYGSLVKHLEVEHLEDVPVPEADSDTYVDLEERVEHVYRLRDEAARLVKEAEELFAEQLGAGGVAGDESGFSRQASELFSGRRRLDGAYYSPKAGDILDRIRATGKAVEPLSQLTLDIVLPNRFKRVYVRDGGVPYLESEPIFKVNPETRKFLSASKTETQTYSVKKGWLLVARSGQTYGLNGSVMLANERHEGAVISEDIIRVIPRPEKVEPGYLQMAMGHPTLGRPLVLRQAFGSSVPHLAPEDLKQFPVIRLGARAEKAIASRVAKAAAMRSQADSEEDKAVQLVEEHVRSLLSEEAAAQAEAVVREP